MKNNRDLVVKSNQLIQAVSNLSLVEIRLMQLAVVDARETGTGITTDTPLIIWANRYSKTFDVTLEAAYWALKEAARTLFDRQFTLYTIDTHTQKEKRITSRWVSQVAYVDDAAKLEIILAPAVVSEITRLESQFTRYYLEQTAPLTSAYAVRLYELLIQWREAAKLPMFELDHFRQQLGLSNNELFRMSDFKKRVLDLAVSQINEHTDITVTYEQHKAGRVITGFTFSLKQKKQLKDVTSQTKPKPKPKPKPSKNTDYDGIDALLKNNEWVSQHAQTGESWEDARARLRREAATGKFSLAPT
jgi:plasmid replication initiation protein